MSSIKNAYASTFNCFKKHSAVLIPFLIFALLESACLILLFLIPRMPLVKFLGPPIRTFWGEKFLHYPMNFLLLPKLNSLSRMFFSVFIGSLLTGSAVAIAIAAFTGGKAKLKNAFKIALKKYLSLFTLVLLITMLFYFLNKATTLLLFKYFLAGHTRLLFIGARTWLGPLSIIVNLGLAIFIQSLFTYTIPLMIAEDTKLIKAIFKSVVLFVRFFFPTLVLVALPMLAYIPIIVLTYNSAFLIDKVFPEIVLVVLFTGTLISSLVVDALTTVSTTFLYLNNRKGK